MQSFSELTKMQLSQQHKSRFLIQKNQQNLKNAKNNFGQKEKPLTLKSCGFALSLNAVSRVYHPKIFIQSQPGTPQ